MEHVVDHNTLMDAEGQAAPLDSPSGSAGEASAPAPSHAAFKPLFFAALIAAAALAGLCGWLLSQRQGSLEREGALSRRLAQLETQLAQQQELVQERDAELEQRDDALAQAQEAIDTLAEYSVAAPDGTVPEYTQLYPDFYAQPWEGERVEGGRVCCLTFDDGPSANTDRVLDILDRYGVKATFFVVGRTGAADQERMKKIVAAGHSLAIHSWTHNYGKIYASVDAFLEDFHQLYQWIYDVTGTYPQVFRFPGGSLNSYNRGTYQEIIAEMTRRGFVYFDWNASAQDATVTPRPAGDIAADCLKGVGRDLVVVLCHDSAARTTTVDALPAVIQGYQNAGYTFSALHPGVRPITFGYPRLQ